MPALVVDEESPHHAKYALIDCALDKDSHEQDERNYEKAGVLVYGGQGGEHSCDETSRVCPGLIVKWVYKPQA